MIELTVLKAVIMHLHRLVGYHLAIVILGVLGVNNVFASKPPNPPQTKPLSPVIFGKSNFLNIFSMFQAL